MSAQDILMEGLLELGRKDARVLLLDCDETDLTGALKFRDAFPERFLQAGVSPASLAGMAKGLAASGEFTPVMAGRADTVARRMTDHLAAMCGNGRRVKFVGLVKPGEGSGRDLALMRALGSVAVYEAADARDAAGLLAEFAAAGGAGYLRVPLWEGPQGAGPASLARTAALREGDDVTLLASGFALAAASKACEKLAAQKVKARLGHARALSPLDRGYAL
ncbi:MAG TPA: transketolase C-terminal domain-containing protein, partial [Candidatus Brocadiia bacterium]|nr:transketolase C-terminal domain-containing protein [Candidatus Brocadiia bacterium]